jgi:hypothetical protein
MKLEYKTQKIEFKDDQIELGSFDGYANTYDVEDSDTDTVVKDAFYESCQKKPIVKLLYQHDRSQVLGIGQIKSDSKGLFIEGKLNLEVAKAKEVGSLMKQGALDSMSVGFVVKDYNNDIEYKNGKRFIKRGEVKEVSIVTFPANPQALINSVKNEKNIANMTIRDFEDFLRDSGFSKQEALKIASKGFKSLQQSDSAEVDDTTLKFYTTLNELIK